jgi:hypothetical protein
METYEQKKRRLFGKQYLPQYLEELNKILKINVDATNLLSIVETDGIRQHILAKELKYATKILFAQKEKLKEMIFNNIERKNDNYYIFTSYSNDCGTLKINLLQDFNFNFSFEDEHVGLITFTREDLFEKIILDFYEENKIQYLDIEILHK